MTTLADIRKKLQALETKKTGGNYQGDKTTYAFWNIPNGGNTTVRFLPDANKDNTFFWAVKQMIKLPFPGIKGDDEHKEVIVQVPCMEMFEGINSCPILAEIRPWWKDPTLEETARKYWVKKSYIFQGLVIKDGLVEDEAPENPIRKFTINKTIFEIIKSALLDPDFENIPTDLVNGTDFTITKGQKGGWADYSTSKWARKESPLTDEQIAAIEQYGLPELSSYLPKKPTPEMLNVIFEMFEASVAGELYDPAKWANYYKPYGLEYDSSKAAANPGSTSTESTGPKVTIASSTPTDDYEEDSSDDDTNEPAQSSNNGSSATGKSAEDILAMIRNRK